MYFADIVAVVAAIFDSEVFELFERLKSNKMLFVNKS